MFVVKRVPDDLQQKLVPRKVAVAEVKLNLRGAAQIVANVSRGWTPGATRSDKIYLSLNGSGNLLRKRHGCTEAGLVRVAWVGRRWKMSVAGAAA